MPNAGDPVTSADGTAVEDYTIRKPICRLAQQVAQSLTTATDVSITFAAGSEEIDTHGFHDETTNNTRITPTLAGYYRLTATMCLSSATGVTNMSVVVRKNGTQVAPLVRIQPASAVNSSRSVQTVVIQSANGVGDWFDMQAQQVSGGSLNTNIGTPLQSVFECEFIRPL